MINILTNTYQVIDPTFGYGTERCIELDMGCGKGKFCLEMAARFPDRTILGADIMIGRIRRIAKKAKRAELTNLQLLRVNNTWLTAFMLPDNCIDRIHVLCPDPWPKSRHRSKRLVTTDFFCRVARILKPNGVLHIATDHPPYQLVLKNVVEKLPFFTNTPQKITDIIDIKTDFELQWLEQGKSVPHLAYTLNL